MVGAVTHRSLVGWIPEGYTCVYRYGSNTYKRVVVKNPIPICNSVTDVVAYGSGLDVLAAAAAAGESAVVDGSIIGADECKRILQDSLKYDGLSGFRGEGEDSICGDKRRYYSNLIRAKSRIEEIGLCNDWDYFVTVTVSPDNAERTDLAEIMKIFNRWMNKNRMRLKRAADKGGLNGEYKPYYLIVPELHKDGRSWHLHGLIRWPNKIDTGFTYKALCQASALSDYNGRKGKLPRYVREKAKEPATLLYSEELEELLGWNVWERIRDKEKTVRYMLKYVSKGWTKTKIETGKHLYYASLGLKKKEPVKDDDFDGCVEDAWGYENDFVQVLWYHK